MRFALLVPNMTGGGAEQVALRLIDHFLSEGIEVDLLLLEPRGELMELIPPAVRIVDLKAPRIRQSVRPLAAYLRREQPRALLAIMWPTTVVAVLARLLARSRTRVVTSEHANLTKQYGGNRRAYLALAGSLRAFYRFADVRVAVSNGVAEDLARLSRLERARFEVIYNPIGTPAPNAAGDEAAELAWQAPRGGRILTVGKLKAEKDHELLIRAFADVARRRTAQLMIVGSGPLRERLEGVAAEEGVADRLILPGFTTDPWPYYHSADLFVLSSTYEGLSLVLMEAMQAGLRVVSTDCESGPRELLADGAYGRLVPVGDRTALADAMLKALADAPDPPRQQARVDFLSGRATLDRYTRLMAGEQMPVGGGGPSA